MNVAEQFEKVEVAVAIIVRDGRILAVLNREWGAYTLPMTKRRRWHDPRTTAGPEHEDWSDAAVRARAECVSGTTTEVPRQLFTEHEFQQSDRDGKWKSFVFSAYLIRLDTDAAISGQARCEWLSLPEFLDENRRPISKTARHVLVRAAAEAKSRGIDFP